jgi:hypothetical protein
MNYEGIMFSRTHTLERDLAAALEQIATLTRERDEAQIVPSRLGRDIAEDIMIALGHDHTDHHKRDPIVLKVWDRLEACGLTMSEDDE